MDYRHSLNRKKYQRDVNRIVRRVNQAIAVDWLWNGRFYIRQKSAQFEIYPDHSGGVLYVELEIHDRKTDRVFTRTFDSYDIRWLFNWWVNEVITEGFKVWNEVPNPHEQAIAEGRRPA